MKKVISNLVIVLVLSLSMTSCYTYTHTVGKGPQTGEEVKKKNHYFNFGTIKGKISDSNKMAQEAKNYNVTTKQTFFDGFLTALTMGFYSPSTTIVKK